jgi:hypothetical protein
MDLHIFYSGKAQATREERPFGRNGLWGCVDKIAALLDAAVAATRIAATAPGDHAIHANVAYCPFSIKGYRTHERATTCQPNGYGFAIYTKLYQAEPFCSFLLFFAPILSAISVVAGGF